MKRLIKKSSLEDWGISLNDLNKSTIDVSSGYQVDDSIKDKIADAYKLYDLLKSIPVIQEAKVISYNIKSLQDIQSTITTNYFSGDVEQINNIINNIVSNFNSYKQLFDEGKNIFNGATEENADEFEKLYYENKSNQDSIRKEIMVDFSKLNSWYISQLIKSKINMSKNIYCNDQFNIDILLNSNGLIEFLNALSNCNNGEKKSYGVNIYLQKFVFPQYMGSDWDTYINLVENYITSSDPTVISNIEDIVNKYPEFKEILDYLTDRTVFRALSFRNEEDFNNCINDDSLFKSGYASGTTDHDLAKKFATKNPFGIIYKCSTSDVIYTWKLLSGQYDEKETIFNTNTASILDKEIIN